MVIVVGIALTWGAFGVPGHAYAIDLDQVDDFEDGTVQGWAEGFVSPNPPTNVPDGGPAGVGDNFLQNVATGGIGAGSRQVMFNRVQWAGDFVSAGVTVIEADMANFGGFALAMRVALQDGLGTRYGSTVAIALPPDGTWQPVSFSLRAGDLSLISGTSTLETALSDVIELRILAAAIGPAWQGDAIASTLGVDNITATAVCPNDCSGQGTCFADTCICDVGWSDDDCSMKVVPIPSLSPWGVFTLGSGLLSAALWRRHASRDRREHRERRGFIGPN